MLQGHGLRCNNESGQGSEWQSWTQNDLQDGVSCVVFAFKPLVAVGYRHAPDRQMFLVSNRGLRAALTVYFITFLRVV